MRWSLCDVGRHERVTQLRVPFHLVRRELNYDKGQVGLVCERPETIFFLVSVHRGELLAELSFHP